MIDTRVDISLYQLEALRRGESLFVKVAGEQRVIGPARDMDGSSLVTVTKHHWPEYDDFEPWLDKPRHSLVRVQILLPIKNVDLYVKPAKSKRSRDGRRKRKTGQMIHAGSETPFRIASYQPPPGSEREHRVLCASCNSLYDPSQLVGKQDGFGYEGLVCWGCRQYGVHNLYEASNADWRDWVKSNPPVHFDLPKPYMGDW